VVEFLRAVSEEREELWGRYCHYEDWKRVPGGLVAVRGLHSNFITSDIIASSRPSSQLINNHRILSQLRQLNVQLVVNLQQPNENIFCSPDPILPSSGFTYEPEVFIQAGISVLNPNWLDNTAPPDINVLVNTCKQMASVVNAGGKILVHCHAGLGRTGTLIAAYLMLTQGTTAGHAISFVRAARPGSINTAQQAFLVDVFESHCAQFTQRIVSNPVKLDISGETTLSVPSPSLEQLE